MNSADCEAERVLNGIFTGWSWQDRSMKKERCDTLLQLYVGRLMVVNDTKHQYPEINLMIGNCLFFLNRTKEAKQFWQGEITLGKKVLKQSNVRSYQFAFIQSVLSAYYLLDQEKEAQEFRLMLGKWDKSKLGYEARLQSSPRNKNDVLMIYGLL